MGNMATTEEISKRPPCIEERYTAATHATNLRVEADTRVGDPLIGAGWATHVEGAPAWSATRTGMALLRLHSEFASAKRARKSDPLPTVAQMAARLPPIVIRVEKGRSIRGPNIEAAKQRLERARIEAERAKAPELRLIAISLPSRSVVWAQIAQWIAVNRMDPDVAAAGLLHWLDQTCKHCDGHGLKKVPDAPALSARQCYRCHGTGNTPYPHGSAKLLVHLDDCVSQARKALGKRLRRDG
jgi:hypothetical protein